MVSLFLQRYFEDTSCKYAILNRDQAVMRWQQTGQWFILQDKWNCCGAQAKDRDIIDDSFISYVSMTAEYTKHIVPGGGFPK